MKYLIRATLLGIAVLASGCIIVPVGEPVHYHHCGYYHC